uniref:Tubulin polyglutamylase TTLL6 n=1 Tax=Lygus hesperus TaxID=30085 RepID=A0A0A9WX28_LYGHE
MMIGQVYIQKPFLIDGFKFDLRMYVLVASCNPLRVYVYDEGLARFATRKYEPTGNNLHLKYMHLTNYSVNKNSSTFVDDEIEGSKRKLSTIHNWLVEHNYNAAKVWDAIDDVIVKTILTALPHMRYNYRVCFPSHVDTVAGFELLGFYFILDHKLKPYLLEVNHTPSFTRCTQLDKEVKDPLMHDVFNLLNLAEDESARIQEDEKTFLNNRLRNKSTARSLEKSRIQQVIKDRETWEEENIGNFRKVFPNENMTKYKPFLKSLLIFPFQKDEFGEISARKLRKNPYEFSPTETDISDSKTMRNLLLSSYKVFNELHMDLAKTSKIKLMEEINESRSNTWNLDEKYSSLYESQKSLFSKGMRSVLKSISKRQDILSEDKEKLSSIFLDPPTFLPEDRESCIDLSDEDEEEERRRRAKETGEDRGKEGQRDPTSQITKIEEIDFIPGVVHEDNDRYRIDLKPFYKPPTQYELPNVKVPQM